MNDVQSMFKHENGSWVAIQECDRLGRFTLFLDDNAGFMFLSSNASRVRDLLDSLEQIIVAARKYAIGSVYGPIIDAASGLRIDGVVLHGWNDLRVWFSISDSGRMVGVRVRNGECVDVYCDH